MAFSKDAPSANPALFEALKQWRSEIVESLSWGGVGWECYPPFTYAVGVDCRVCGANGEISTGSAAATLGYAFAVGSDRRSVSGFFAAHALLSALDPGCGS